MAKYPIDLINICNSRIKSLEDDNFRSLSTIIDCINSLAKKLHHKDTIIDELKDIRESAGYIVSWSDRIDGMNKNIADYSSTLEALLHVMADDDKFTAKKYGDLVYQVSQAQVGIDIMVKKISSLKERIVDLMNYEELRKLNVELAETLERLAEYEKEHRMYTIAIDTINKLMDGTIR